MNLVEEEEQVTGNVTFKDYKTYINYSMGVCGIILYFIVCSSAVIAQLYMSLFLADWAS